MTSDDINEIVWNIEEAQREYIARRMERLGYSREYRKEHKYDFITVQVNAGGIYCVINVPEQRELFWFEREIVKTKERGELTELDIMTGGGFEYSFHPYYLPEDAPEIVRKFVEQCMEQAAKDREHRIAEEKAKEERAKADEETEQ